MNSRIDALRSRYWLIAEVIISLVVVVLGFLILPAYVSPEFNPMEFVSILGGDSLVLMGFIIEALAIIGALVDREALDQIRDKPAFSDLWMTFVLSAVCLGLLAIFGRLSSIFAFPELFLYISGFLAVFNILLIGSCIWLLAKFILAVSAGRSSQRASDQNTGEVILSDE